MRRRDPLPEGSLLCSHTLPCDVSGLPSSSICIPLLRDCGDSKGVSSGRLLHCVIIQSRLERSGFVDFSLTRMYGRSGALDDAEYLFSVSRERDKFSWNNMIKSYGQYGLPHEALQCLDRMQLEGVLPDMFIYATALSECSYLDSPHRGLQLHSVITGSGMEIDGVVGTALINMYGKTGRLVDAHSAFDMMDNHDVASWNAIMWSYAQSEQVGPVLELFEQMQQQRTVPNEITFIGIFSAFATPEVLNAGMHMHHFVIAYGFEADLNLGNAVVNMYGKCASLENAQEVFEFLMEKNTLSWTVMMTSLVQHGQGNEALILFERMRREGVLPDKIAYIGILSACADYVALGQGQMIHASVPATLQRTDVELNNSLINMYSKCSSLEAAERIFDEMTERSTISWNALMAAFIQHGRTREAIKLFFQMQAARHVPDRVTFLSILSACVQDSTTNGLSIPGFGRDIHSMIVCSGFDEDIAIGNALLHMYKKHDSSVEAWKIFDKLLGRNSISWNVMISKPGPSKGAFQLYAQMLQEGILPCKGTITCLLIAAGSPELIKLGKEMHACLDVANFELDISTGNRLIEMYRNCGSMGHVEDVFSCMQKHDSITLTGMMAGYSNKGQNAAALRVFQLMQQEGVGADRVTYISIFSACTTHVTLAMGRLVHACIVKTVFECDISVGNALINMYGKCGSLKESHRVFNQMPVHDVVSWSSMIANYALHGRSNEALEMFHEMQKEQILPDQVTFISVLCACSHSGSVAEGWYWFEFMKKNLSIKPSLDHYNCMIDMLGRAGMLEEAEKLIRCMPLEADAVTWITLLCACWHHLDVERGEDSAGHVFKLDPSDPAVYVMLSNIYSRAGREDDAARIVSWMEMTGLNQSKNCSFIEVAGVVHQFHDDDKSHSRIEEIKMGLLHFYKRLCNMKLLSDSKEINTEFFTHSEMLALAFGIMNTSPPTPLVIITKSHLCSDCHLIIKLASKVTSREISVKNNRHFHYMKNGVCSCGDN